MEPILIAGACVCVWCLAHAATHCSSAAGCPLPCPPSLDPFLSLLAFPVPPFLPRPINTHRLRQSSPRAPLFFSFVPRLLLLCRSAFFFFRKKRVSNFPCRSNRPRRPIRRVFVCRAHQRPPECPTSCLPAALPVVSFRLPSRSRATSPALQDIFGFAASRVCVCVCVCARRILRAPRCSSHVTAAAAASARVSP